MKKLIMMLGMSAMIFTSCDNNDENAETATGLFSGVNSVTELPLDATADAKFKVDFYVNNGCGMFSSFDETTEGNTHVIKVLTKYEGDLCTMDVPLREAVYTFNARTAGTYTLKFMKTDGTFFTETVVAE